MKLDIEAVMMTVISVYGMVWYGFFLYSAVSSPLDRSKRFTLSSPGRPVHSDTVLGFSWKHSSHAAIAQRLFTHIAGYMMEVKCKSWTELDQVQGNKPKDESVVIETGFNGNGG